MISDILSAILQELAQAMELSELKPDQNQSCLIRFANGIKVQLELDKTESFLIIGCNLGEVSPGKYREGLFQEAMRSNVLAAPSAGRFAYSRQLRQLVLFEMLYLKDLNGQKVADFLTPFLEKAQIWSEAITRGELPATATQRSVGLGGLFGLRP